MPWYFPGSEALKKRACRYLLQRYLGQFLQEKIGLDQLSVNLSSGKGVVRDLLLDAELINETFNSANLPFEMVDGFIGAVSLEIPWTTLLSKSTQVEIDGLEVTLRPKQVSEKSYMLDSMWGSMTKSSMQLAEECLKDEERNKSNQTSPFEGLEQFAQAIDIVLTRIKVNFTNIVVRLEQLQDDSKAKAVALEVRIKRVNYFDEAAAGSSAANEDVNYQPLPIANKCFLVEGLTIYTDEYKYPGGGSSMTLSTVSSATVLENSEMYYSSADLQPAIGDVPLSRHVTDSRLHKDGSGNLVQIAVCHGTTEIHLKVKQNNELTGPKFELTGNIGVLHAIMWPKQLEMLRDLFGEIWLGHEEGEKRHKRKLQKPMTDSDYSKIENELQRDFDARQHQTKGGNSLRLATWDNQRLPHEEDEFFALGSRVPLSEDGIYRSQPDTKFEMSTSPHKFGDSVITLNSAKIKVKSLFLTLIEENPEQDAFLPFPFAEVQKCNAEHFDALSDIEEFDLQDTLALRDKFARSISQGHLWFYASTAIFECYEKRSSSALVQTMKASLGSFEAWEHLFDARESETAHHTDSVLRLKTVPLCTELLTFPYRNPEDRFSFVPCVMLEFESVDKFGDALPEVCLGDAPTRVSKFYHFDESRCQSISQRLQMAENLLNRPVAVSSRSEIKLTLQPAKMDVDITLVDRLTTLAMALEIPEKRSESAGYAWAANTPPPRRPDSVVPLDLTVTCSSLTAHVRFPVLDLRPLSDRTPWWTRSLQKESLVVNFSGILLKTRFDEEPLRKIELECRGLSASFQSSPDEKPVLFLKALRDVDLALDEGRREEFADCPRMSIFVRKTAPNVVPTDILLDPKDERAHRGSLEGIFEAAEKEPSLFAVSRNMIDHEETKCVIPALPSDAQLFKENVMSNSQVVIDIFVPHVTAFIPDKRTLEILYNRINTDFLLWEASGPRTKTDVVPLSAAHLMGSDALKAHRSGSATHMYEMCRSSGGDDSDEASDVDDSEEDYGTQKRLADQKTAGLLAHRRKIPSDICMMLNIGKAGVGAKIEHPLADKSVIVQEGWIDINGASIFSVSGYHGQPEIRYSSIKAQKFSLYYGDYVDTGIPKAEQIATGLRRPSHLVPVVVPLEDSSMMSSSTTSLGQSMEEQPMLNVAIEIRVDTFRNIKDIKVALELAIGKLNYLVTLPEHFWLTQMIDYVNLKDFPVLGYNSPTIITEFHLTISNAAVEYRPKYLPVKSLVTLDRVNVSSTIVAASPQSLLRVITQDLRVHLSKKRQPVVLKEDYVCVADVPFLEFQMKLTDGTNPQYPKFDFRASNNCCYIRTCSDSCAEISGLLVYLANYGDLNIEPKSPKLSESMNEITPVVEIRPQPEESDGTEDEMIDAMQESPPRRNSHPKRNPAQNAMVTSISVFPSSSGSVKTSLSEVHDIDDEGFCLLEEDPGAGIMPKGGEPGVKFFTSEPIRIVENHFGLPLAATDQLKSPDGYPLPIIRLTLKEMSLVWCLYGGKDFDEKPPAPSRKLGPQNRLNSAPANLGASRSPSGRPEGSVTSVHSPSWLIKGGPGRDHSVLMEIHLNKVKFQHEQYPFDGKSTRAARQVLFIQDFEIHDRLARSDINKFLYQHTSFALPKQSHASMFSIKALHERPDPALPMQECTLKVSLQPLRLNVDQESLFFLSDFFADVAAGENSKRQSSIPETDVSPESPSSVSFTPGGPKDHLPVRTKKLESLDEEVVMLQDPLIRFDDVPKEKVEEAKLNELLDLESSNAPSDAPIFFKSVTFSPAVPIRLDYHGKHVDVERVGALGGLLVGLAQLNCTLLQLKSVHNRQGIRGIDRVVLAILSEWITDIRKTQLANLLAGVGPMHCFVQLVQGVRDLFWLPVEQYRKDGRIVRGVQRGASAFTTSTLIATIELTNRIVQTIQVAAESAYDVISPGPSFRKKRRKASTVFPKTRPGDIREGVVTAYQVLCEGFTDTARDIVDAVSKEHEEKGVTGAVGGAFRQIGPAIVKPLILASQATSNVLSGVRNQLQPEYRLDEQEKWRTQDDVKHHRSQTDVQ